MRKRTELCIRPGFAILAAVFLLGPFRRTAGLTLLAAIIHEFGHIAVIRAFGAGIERIELCLTGAVIVPTAEPMLGYGAEILVSLAGAAANLGLVFFSVVLEWYALAGASTLLCLGNLLPVLPLDGGRALFFLLCRFFEPKTAFYTVNAVAMGLGCGTVILAIANFGAGTRPASAALGMLGGAVILRTAWNVFRNFPYF